MQYFKDEITWLIETWRRWICRVPKDCIEYCKLELIRKERKCVDFFNYYPHSEPLCETGCEDVLCSRGYKDINNMSSSLVKFAKTCADKCRPGCE
ncbi:amiloride-sensitive sodium channel subunit alpha [Nephila pilipes]|uniref:Amiloride-sensitive sodium channel subunit alpha n=1 Tax=Nephila pilipes TaxID=299642 RepID=A0A8X6TX09_NEPPI|nr:amiloride-sensitive sodium channel subunit alpha [Nephila pilipes]